MFWYSIQFIFLNVEPAFKYRSAAKMRELITIKKQGKLCFLQMNRLVWRSILKINERLN